MNLDTAPSFHRARQLSRFVAAMLSISFWITAATLPAVMVAILFFHDAIHESLVSGQPAITLASLAVGQRVSLVADLLLYSVPSLFILFYLRALFARFASGEVFTGANIARIRLIGLLLLVSAVTTNLAQVIFFRIVGVAEPDFDFKLLPLLYGAITYIAAYIITEAQRIADDNASIV
jgi:hypothetical protein